MLTEHLLLELEQLDHQAGQRLVGGRLSLDVLREQQHREAIRAELQRGHTKINYSVPCRERKGALLFAFIFQSKLDFMFCNIQDWN